jgi:hypothetical protein
MQSKIFQGLKKRPTFNEIVGYLETEQQILKYPDRTATRIKDDPYYTNLDGQGGLSLGEQSKNLQKEQMRQLELNKIYQNMGISANVGRAMGIDRADGSESIVSGSNRSGGSNGSEYGGGGSVFGSVADSNIEDDYEALETFGKEQETLKEDKTKKISEKVAPAVQPSFVDTFTGGASSSSAPAAKTSAAAASSQSNMNAFNEHKKLYGDKTQDQLIAEYSSRFGRVTKAKKETIIDRLMKSDRGIDFMPPPPHPDAQLKKHFKQVEEAARAIDPEKKGSTKKT